MQCLKAMIVAVCASLSFGMSAIADESQDSRKLIELPGEIQAKMLDNMRDHVAALDEIIASIENGKFENAEQIAEYRLGWSSLVRRGEQDIADHWAIPMQKMADNMYRSASEFVIVVQNAWVEDDKESYRKILSSLRNVTSACRSCHESFRVR